MLELAMGLLCDFITNALMVLMLKRQHI